MLDSALRPVKDRMLRGIVAGPVGALPPLALSAAGLALTLGSAAAAWATAELVAVALWLAGRLADGLDGAVARRQGTASDVGGLVDFTFDSVGYAAVPLGVAAGLDDRTVWIMTGLLLASFYVNAVTLGYVSALLVKRADRTGIAMTSTPLPRGVVEGTETIAFFTVALAAPDAAGVVWAVMAGAVAVTAAERLLWAHRALR